MTHSIVEQNEFTKYWTVQRQFITAAGNYSAIREEVNGFFDKITNTFEGIRIIIINCFIDKLLE